MCYNVVLYLDVTIVVTKVVTKVKDSNAKTPVKSQGPGNMIMLAFAQSYYKYNIKLDDVL